MPFSLANSSKCSRPVRLSQSTSCCGHTPMTLVIKCISCFTDMPKMVQSPPDSGINPVSMLKVVDFPAPLWPNSTNKLSSSTAYDTPRTAAKDCTLFVGTSLKRKLKKGVNFKSSTNTSQRSANPPPPANANDSTSAGKAPYVRAPAHELEGSHSYTLLTNIFCRPLISRATSPLRSSYAPSRTSFASATTSASLLAGSEEASTRSESGIAVLALFAKEEPCIPHSLPRKPQ
mmetsp:Transcript_61217/g.122721  ORF Transcript_61217/g.122721 Transcript_61217/m.122721 type:complete len:232 (+) Transcript_61217:282-977(+)